MASAPRDDRRYTDVSACAEAPRNTALIATPPERRPVRFQPISVPVDEPDDENFPQCVRGDKSSARALGALLDRRFAGGWADWRRSA